MSDVKQALASSDDLGELVNAQTASDMLKAMRAHGFIELRRGEVRLALPSLASHFEAVRRDIDPHNDVAIAVRAALDARVENRSQGRAR